MRLLKASTLDEPSGLRIMDFAPNNIPRYAILSHTWGADEVVYADIQNRRGANRESFQKIRYSCNQTLADGYDYVWIDSCCIDKSSSAELSEAINTFYEWYQKAEVCYAYLSDVSTPVDASDPTSEFACSRWFTRGFTLQELLAPRELIFFSQDWTRIGEKATLSRPLSTITRIDEEILKGSRSPSSVSIAKRMSWAASRETTRPEDIAYCLMGIFDVNMPMLYGEGSTKAFLRLQEEIMKQSDDQSLFAWLDTEAKPGSFHGLLAESPRNFAQSNNMQPYEDWEPRPPYSMTNRGLCISLPMTLNEKVDNGKKTTFYTAALDCPCPGRDGLEDFLGLHLQKLSNGDQQFARIDANKFSRVHQRGRPHTIYVRQGSRGWASEAEGVFPRHVLQLRRGPPPHLYHVQRTIVQPGYANDPPRGIASSQANVREWIPVPHFFTFRVRKGINLLAGAVLFEGQYSERLLVMLGSVDSLTVGFQAVELPPLEEEEEDSELAFEQLQKRFTPSPVGVDVDMEYQRVRVDTQNVVANATKYVMVDISIYPAVDRSRLLQLLLGVGIQLQPDNAEVANIEKAEMTKLPSKFSKFKRKVASSLQNRGTSSVTSPS